MDPFRFELRRFRLPRDTPLGFEVNQDDGLFKVVSVRPHGLAECAGIDLGWYLIVVNGRPMVTAHVLEHNDHDQWMFTFAAPRTRALATTRPWAYLGTYTAKRAYIYTIVRLDFSRFHPSAFRFIECDGMATFAGCNCPEAMKNLDLELGDNVVGIDGRALLQERVMVADMLKSFKGDLIDLTLERGTMASESLYLHVQVPSHPSSGVFPVPTDLQRNMAYRAASRVQSVKKGHKVGL